MNEEQLKKHISLHHRMTVRHLDNKLHEDLSNIEFDFAAYNGKYGAAYNMVTKRITYYIEGRDWEKFRDIDLIMFYPELIIHEQTHAICDRYELCDSFLDGEHNISFSLMNYCLQRDILGKRFNFYQQYDMQDEIAKVNPQKLDELINSIEFNSVKQLAYKSLKYAEYVRKNILKTVTYSEWYQKEEMAEI